MTKMSKSEAGKLGGYKSGIITTTRLNNRITEYNQNPTLCKECKSPFGYFERTRSFCNSSCSAIYNNKNRDPSSRAKQKITIRKKFRTKETEFKEYQAATNFKFSKDEFSKILGYELLLERGMYNTRTNRSGVVRDHIFSRYDGYINNVSPEIIAHPANCQFIPHLDNTRKRIRSDISLDELLERIQKWK